MAGLGQSPSPNTHLSATSRRVPSPTRSRALPNGACTYRDLSHGGTCGCNQFWDKDSAELHAGSNEKRASSERSTWCVCSHHACFHKLQTSAAVVENHISAHKGIQLVPEEPASLGGSPAFRNGRLKASTAPHSLPSQGLPRQSLRGNSSSQHRAAREGSSLPSTSGLPSVPSVCFLSHDKHPATDVRNDASEGCHGVSGLGLSLINLESVGTPAERPPSISSTVPDEVVLPHGSYSESELPSTRANSIPGDTATIGVSAAEALDQVLVFNRNLQLDISGDTIPNTCNPEDFIQSATEAATPSNANTPNLAGADHAVQETRKLVETLTRATANLERLNGSDTRPNSAASVRVPQLLLTNSPATRQEQIQQAIRSASPQALKNLVSYLGPLHSLLNSFPNVATTIREINSRLDLLENQSFNYVHPEELQNHFDAYDGRLLDIEHRMDDHDRLHQAIDADQSSNSLGRRRVATVTESYNSNHSVQSTTSSALIVAAMDRKDIDNQFESLKDRLDVLEAAALPTAVNPWEVEMVLLPWGRDLRGIWFSPDAPMHDTANPTTQDSEEWTQARSLKPTNSVHASSLAGPASDSRILARPLSKDSEQHSEAGSGWSSQAISDWVTGAEDPLLSPKACGSNNLVYRRLQSRGFVKDLTLKSANSRDIQATLSKAFSDILEHLEYADTDGHHLTATYPGLKASFIPLRKAYKESRLRFLSPAEMAAGSAIWSAQFLAHGVMMRVSGGKRRLYVTQPEAYLQLSEENESYLTWQKLRELPRFQPDQDSQMEGNDEHCQLRVGEADAREACWAFVEAYDHPPVSVNSSFNSNQSAELSMRPADRQWRRSITPSSILKNKIPQPISPLSENHPRRPSHNRYRTVSASIIEPLQQQSSKRRLQSSPVKSSSLPQSVSRAPSVALPRLKRRRTANSPSLQAREQEPAALIWNHTPRMSREPPSPFPSSHPPLPRSNSDVASRPSQRSIAIVGKATPFAYATPHSGPYLGGGGFGDEAGDTEPGEYLGDDHEDEQSWRGVDEEGNESGSSTSESDVEAGAEDPGSFSGDESGFESEDADDDDGDDDAFDGVGDHGFGAQQRTDDEDEEGEDVFDTLLGVLQH
ncbi:hypothetical protein BDV96DRAFT_631894 [Lophiotrema nucula]|uniref:Uncharacterized protein n=1 Tax=Lophiotrema nucula TaxID=690887 RepID=A0A6A5Z849_9PLEO|nr:hypothetical protein BDV96DRAFT_631894 [Lophiotrema nucula]